MARVGWIAPVSLPLFALKRGVDQVSIRAPESRYRRSIVGAPVAPDYIAALDEEALQGATVAAIDSDTSANTAAVFDDAMKSLTEELGATLNVVAEPEPSLRT